MALTLEESRYPLSSADGRDIRLDVLGPISTRSIVVDDSPMASLETLEDLEDIILEIHTDVKVVIGFTNEPIDLVVVDGDYVMQANTTIFLLPIAAQFSLICPIAAESGTVDINVLRKWNTLAIKTDEA